MSNTLPTRETAEATVRVEYDPDLRGQCRIEYRHVAGDDPLLVLTFGDTELTGDGWLPVVHALRAEVAPRGIDDELIWRAVSES